MKLKWRLRLFGLITIGAIILITLIAAPANNKLNSGSTYNRAPEGYGAWYAFMSQRGTPIQRWRKPFEDLANKNNKAPIILLRVNSTLQSETYSAKEEDWVKTGNSLVLLGVRTPVTKAAFSSKHNTEFGIVKIDTQRRNQSVKEERLRDSFGAIVWERKVGKGSVIYCSTPHLAANAYQDYPGNYEFLAQIVTHQEQPIWVDEYIHGYKDNDAINDYKDNDAINDYKDNDAINDYKDNDVINGEQKDEYIHGYKDNDAIKCEQNQDIFSYFAQTPLLLALIQVGILLLVAIWAGNHRFGKPLTLEAQKVDNTQAYIQALSDVLQKAESSEFILEVLGKEEQLQLQKALFLGDTLVETQIVIDAWVQKTGRPAVELAQLLQTQAKKPRMNETQLLEWLTKWKQVRRHINLTKINSKYERT